MPNPFTALWALAQWWVYELRNTPPSQWFSAQNPLWPLNVLGAVVGLTLVLMFARLWYNAGRM